MKKRGRDCVRGGKRGRGGGRERWREGGRGGREGGRGGREGGREGREGTIQNLAHTVGTRNLHTGIVLYQFHGPMQLLFSVCHNEVAP